MARKINNRQKLRVTHRDPIARLLPLFKARVTRNRTKYSRKGREAQRLRRGMRCSKRPVPDAPVLRCLSTVTHGAAIGILERPPASWGTPSASIVNRRLLLGARRLRGARRTGRDHDLRLGDSGPIGSEERLGAGLLVDRNSLAPRYADIDPLLTVSVAVPVKVFQLDLHAATGSSHGLRSSS